MNVYDGERYYHGIPGLLVPRKTGMMHDRIHLDINKFIDAVPGMIGSIEANFANISVEKRRGFLIKNIEILCSMLQSIYARGLEADSMRLLRFVKTDTMTDQARKLMPTFIMDILSLSVALQRAQNFDSAEVTEQVSEIEVFANIAKSLLTVRSLFDDGEYESAQRIITEMVVYNPNEDGIVKMLHLTAAKKYDEAKTLSDTLYKKCTEAITELAGIDLSKTILAVDDMPEILSFVNNALKNHCKVIAVPGGKMALKVLETKTPDLFLLDIDMPEMNGFELAGIIRNKIEYAETPLIFLTGNSTREHIATAMAVGCNDFIVKPASHDYLLTKVGKFLHSK